MGHSHDTPVDVKDPGTLQVSSKLKTLYSVLMAIGVLAFVVTLASGNAERAWHAYLIGLFYTVSLALGGLFLTSIHHLTRAGWSVNVRRFFEAFTSYLPWAAGMAIILLIFGAGHLYEWLHKEAVESDPLLQHKASYLNQTFFWIRTIGFFGLWIYFSRVFPFSRFDSSRKRYDATVGTSYSEKKSERTGGRNALTGGAFGSKASSSFRNFRRTASASSDCSCAYWKTKNDFSR